MTCMDLGMVHILTHFEISFNRVAQSAGPDYVNFWVRRCTHKVQEAMQTYIQEGLENKIEKYQNSFQNDWTRVEKHTRTL